LRQNVVGSFKEEPKAETPFSLNTHTHAATVNVDTHCQSSAKGLKYHICSSERLNQLRCATNYKGQYMCHFLKNLVAIFQNIAGVSSYHPAN
jgi:hypothetical protein